MHPALAMKVIAHCAILHNFCFRDRDTLEPVEEPLGPDDGGGEHQPDLQCGEELCGHIATAQHQTTLLFMTMTVTKETH